MTITDADLERLLGLAAGEFAVPVEGPETVLAAAREGSVRDVTRLSRARAWRPSPKLVVGVASLVLVAAFGVGVANLGGGSKRANSTAGVTPAIAKAPTTSVGAPADNALAGAQLGRQRVTAVPAAGPAVVEATSGSGAVTSGNAAAGVPSAGPAPVVTAPQVKSAPGPLTPADGARLVRTGQAAVTVGKGGVPVAGQKLEGLAASLNGYVAREASTTGDSPTVDVTVRVPGDRYQALLDGIRQLGTVANLSTQASDVTAQYTDLQARVHALQATRNTYLALLAKANTINETLSVQQRIDDVQQQLEQFQGQLKVLGSQSDFGSLDVTVAEKGATPKVEPVSHPRTGFSKAWHDATRRFSGGLEGIVAVSGPLALAVLILAALGGIGWLGRRTWRRSRV